MLYHCHMIPGAAVPKVVWIFYKTGEAVSILGKRIRLMWRRWGLSSLLWLVAQGNEQDILLQ